MARNWIRYLTVLLFAFVFFLCFNGYLSQYVLIVTLLMPAVSLLLSLPGALGAKASLVLGAPSAQKGGQIPLRLKVWNRFPLAGGRAWVTLDVENTLTGESQRERMDFTPCRGKQILEQPLSSPLCGQVVCRVSQGWVCDYLGLFALPLRRPEQCRQSALFYPALHSAALSLEPRPMPEADGERYSQTKPGDDPSELFGLREYREGDKLSRVHWKLSQKTGQTLYKELGLPITNRILFLLEPNGSGVEADALLDAFATLSGFLCQHETAHRVGFWNGNARRFELLEITDLEDSRPALDALLITGCRASLPSPGGENLPAGTSHILYLSAHPNGKLAAELCLRMPSARLSVLTVSEEAGDSADLPTEAEVTAVRPGRISEDLAGFVL